MSGLLAAALALASGAPEGVEVRVTPRESGAALEVQLGPGSGGVAVLREDDELVVHVEGRPELAPLPPAPRPPIEDVRVVTALDHFEVRARVASGVSHEVRREGALLTVLFQAGAPAPTASERAAAARLGFEALYRSLFPRPLDAEASTSARAAEAGEEAGPEGQADGLALGPLRLRPALLVAWVDGEAVLGDTAQTSRDAYFQIEPRLGASIGVRLGAGGHLAASYEPVFRSQASFAVARRPSHDLRADALLPLGPLLQLRGSAERFWGALETNQVDPGREYFFDLARFRSERYAVGLRAETGGRVDFDLSAELHRARFEERSAFFDYDQRGFTAEAGYDLTPDVRAGLAYVVQDVPENAARPEARSRSRGARIALRGRLAATLSGEAGVGWETRESPNAGAGGRRFSGAVAHARLVKELSRATSLTLAGSRFTTLSAFEDDAFFVANRADATLSLPAPLQTSLRLGAGWHRNDYRTPASGLGVPRRDTLRGWSLGLGRSLTRWSFARLDYRRDRRDSNLDLFDTVTWSLVAQIGLGFLGGTERP